MMAKESFNIDLVYCWVDGNNPKFAEEKQYWLEKLGIKHNNDNDNTRFFDNQELRYSLRSVMKNAPWINKIFIITNGQVPSWLNLEKTDKIKIVRHDEIMPKEILPCYNSRVIESYIANIPDLSEHFIYANDDMSISRPVEPDFFFDKEGKPIVRFFKADFSYRKLKKSLYIRSIFYTHKLFQKKYNKFNLYVPHHNIDAYLKSAYLETIKEFQKEFDTLRTHRFRQKSIQRIAFSLYLAYAKKCKIELSKGSNNGYNHQDAVFLDISEVEKMQRAIIRKSPQLLCINDESYVKESNRENVKPFFESLYDKKQVWENDDTEIDFEQVKIYKKKYIENIEAIKKEKIKQIFQNIFCVKNDKKKKYKILTFLGVNFKFKINEEERHKKQYEIIQKNYKQVLKRIREKYKNGDKIKVVFLSNECQKWTYNSLYHRLDKSEQFEPLVAVFPRFRNGKIDTAALSVEKNIEYYRSLGIKTVNLYENEQIHDLEELSPDIVFYQQKPGILKNYSHQKISKYALTMFSSYGFEIENLKVNYSPNFQQLMFLYFTEHNDNVERYRTYNRKTAKNLVVMGYPRLDSYLDNTSIDLSQYWKQPEKYKIIYTPHYSIVKGGDQSYALSTFLENGKLILELAKSHPETTWIFRPHPRLAYELMAQNAWSEEEINAYYEEWANIGNIHLEGNCIDLFKTSDLMLTDSSAFLAEYLPSKHPVIWMKRKDRSELNSIGKKITNTYYQSNNNEELKELFNELVVNKNDYKKEERLNIIPEIIDFNKSCADKIYEYILNLLEGEINV